MRKLVLIPLAALVFATSCGDDSGSADDSGPSAADRDCTGKSLPPQADATTPPTTARSTPTSAAPPASTDGSPTTTASPATSTPAPPAATAPTAATDAADGGAATSTPSGWMRPGLSPRTSETSSPDAGSTGSSTPPPTTYAPKPDIELPDPLPKKLKVTDLEQGNGPKAKRGDTVIVHYVGVRSEDGTEFDSNYDSKEGLPVVIGQSNVIQGWHQGLVGMQVGGVRQLDIPPDLAYGDTPPDGTAIEKGDTLTFVVTLDTLLREPKTTDVEPSLCAKELGIEDLRKGSGNETAKQGDTVTVHLKVLRGDNKVVINDTWTTGETAQLVLDDEQLPLPGLVKGIQGMKVGGQRVITMPPPEAFGWDGAPSQGIPADTDVIAIIDLVAVNPG